MSLDFYAFIFAIAILATGILALFIAVFKSSLLKKLSTRIAVLILPSGPLTIFLIAVSNHFRRVIGVQNHQATLVVYVLIALIVPVIFGLLAARFIQRPLRQFNETVASLKLSNYDAQLKSTGVSEFDETFSEFNDLIQRLQNEEKLRKELVSDTSHELNTPLTIMIGQLTAVQEGKYKMTKERVDILKEQAERLEELVQQLSAYTKARIPNTAKAEDIQLHQFCTELIKRFSAELKQKRITTQLHIPEDYKIHANRGALQQIFTNLMQNALRYSQATELTIAANDHQLTFSDNGKGVPSESLPYLFERFYRVDKSRTRETGGLGLGLAIVKELAEQQGWQIQAKQAHPGVSFILALT
jgi:signal transduction histidine kinase